MDINTTAASLLDGGWLPKDRDLIQEEYGFDDDEIEAIVKEMKLFIQDEQFDPDREKARDIIRAGHYNAAVELMDDELREQIHDELAPCSDVDFLTRYLKEHQKKFGEEFILN